MCSLHRIHPEFAEIGLKQAGAEIQHSLVVAIGSKTNDYQIVLCIAVHKIEHAFVAS